LAELQARGYKVVHMRAKGSVEPQPDLVAKLAPMLAKSQKAAAASTLMPFYGMVKPGDMAGESLAVTEIAPAARARPDGKSSPTATKVASTRTAVRGWTARAEPAGDWGTTVVVPNKYSAPHRQ
jgi:hypothetical protein